MSAEPKGLRGTEVVYMRMRYRRGTLVLCAQQRKPTKNASPRAEQRNLPPPHYGIGERGLTPKNATVPSLRAAREFKKSKLWKIQSNGKCSH